MPATRGASYFFYTLSEPIDKDIWIQAFEFKSSNIQVTHHFTIYQILSGTFQEELFQSGYRPIHLKKKIISRYTPGRKTTVYPDEFGIFIPKGTELLFQSHYISTGMPEKNWMEIGLHIRDKEPPRKLIEYMINDNQFIIPPHEKNYKVVKAGKRITERMLIHGFYPHMHLRGKSMKFTAQYPDGTSEILFSVPDLNFYKQYHDFLENPKEIPAGSRIILEGVFDNSSQNPDNPDPSQIVVWGGGGNDEVFKGTLFMSLFDQSKDLTDEEVFKSEGIREVRRHYFQSGKIEKEIYLKDGIRHGVTKRYYENGELEKKRMYNNGRLVDAHGQGITGTEERYDENGTLIEREVFKDGYRDGVRQIYYKNGNIRAELHYKYKNYHFTNEYDENGKFIERNRRRLIYSKNEIPIIKTERIVF